MLGMCQAPSAVAVDVGASWTAKSELVCRLMRIFIKQLHSLLRVKYKLQALVFRIGLVSVLLCKLWAANLVCTVASRHWSLALGSGSALFPVRWNGELAFHLGIVCVDMIWVKLRHLMILVIHQRSSKNGIVHYWTKLLSLGVGLQFW